MRFWESRRVLGFKNSKIGFPILYETEESNIGVGEGSDRHCQPRRHPQTLPRHTMAALLRAAGVSRTASKAMQQTRGYKVAVLGAAGGIGQPCGLLMKMVRAPPIATARAAFARSRRGTTGTANRATDVRRVSARSTRRARETTRTGDRRVLLSRPSARTSSFPLVGPRC